MCKQISLIVASVKHESALVMTIECNLIDPVTFQIRKAIPRDSITYDVYTEWKKSITHLLFPTSYDIELVMTKLTMRPSTAIPYYLQTFHLFVFCFGISLLTMIIRVS